MNRLRPTAAEARGAVARPGRPADRAGFARSRGRLLLRTEDRPPQSATSSWSISPARPPPRPSHLSLSDAGRRAGFRRRRAGAARGSLTRGSARLAGLGVARRFSCGTGRTRSARRPARWTAGVVSIGEESRASRRSPSRSATTRPRPARPNYSSAKAWRQHDFLYFFLGAFSAADWCSTARSISAAPATPRLSARCRRRAGRRRTGDTQLIARARSINWSAASRAAGRDPSSIWLTPERLGRFRPLSTMARRGRPRARLRIRLGDLGDRRRRDRHRRGDAAGVRQSLCACGSPRRSKAGPARPLGSDDRRRVVGAEARAIGAAALPLIKNFARDREVVFKDAPGELNPRRSPPARREATLRRPGPDGFASNA